MEGKRLSTKKIGDRIVAVRWRGAKNPRQQWSIHVLKRAVIEQDLLLFDGVVAVPMRYWLQSGVEIYIGLWMGHERVHWTNWLR